MQLHTATNPLWQFFNAIFTDIQLAFSKYQLVPVYDSQPNTSKTALCSGGFRKTENFWVATLTSGHAGSPNCQTEYLEATLGLVKRLEISKELIRERVTVPGCCCCCIFI